MLRYSSRVLCHSYVSILSPPRTSHRFFGTVLRTGRSRGGGEGPEYPLPCW